MGLYDTFPQPRSQLLLPAELHTVYHAYYLLIQDEVQPLPSQKFQPTEHSVLQMHSTHEAKLKPTNKFAGFHQVLNL